MVDFDALMQPIDPDNPSGIDIRLDAADTTFAQLEEMRQEVDPAIDPGGQAKSADWAGVVRLAGEVLAERTKDLELAAIYTQGLAIQEGLPGLLTGLRLVRGLVTDFWETVHPGWDDGEIIEPIRARPLSWLGSAKDFQLAVKKIPLSAPIGDVPRTWFDYEQSQRVDKAAVQADQGPYQELLEAGFITGEQWRGSLAATPPERMAEVRTGLTDCLAELEELGADSICIKDMAGLVTPEMAFELVARMKYAVKIPVQFHTHFTSGMATAACINAAEAGADVVDAAISSMAMGTAQPPIETLVGVFEGTRRDTGLELDLLMEIAAYFADVRQRYARFERQNKGVDVSVLRYQIPGGMISNLVAQLREQNALDRYQEVMAEVPRVRADLGYPPLVTPSSQIVGTQATLNVLLGERYKVIPQEVKAYLKGLYGQPPGPVNEDLRRKAIGDEKPITCRPADLLKPGYEQAKKEIGDLAKSEEDVLSYALFPQVARAFLKRRERGARLEDEAVAAIAAVLARQEGWVAERPSVPVGAAISPWKLSGRPLGRRGGWIRW